MFPLQKANRGSVEYSEGWRLAYSGTVSVDAEKGILRMTDPLHLEAVVVEGETITYDQVFGHDLRPVK